MFACMCVHRLVCIGMVCTCVFEFCCNSLLNMSCRQLRLSEGIAMIHSLINNVVMRSSLCAALHGPGVRMKAVWNEMQACIAHKIRYIYSLWQKVKREEREKRSVKHHCITDGGYGSKRKTYKALHQLENTFCSELGFKMLVRSTQMSSHQM